MSPKITNPYKVLGIPDNSPIEVCKKAYKQLARKSHPDLGGDAEEFCLYNDAYHMIESGYKVVSFTAPSEKAVRHVNLMNFAVVDN